MHPRIVMLAITGIITDLLCIAAAATLLLSNNPWLNEVGVARFGFVALLVGIGLVPMMYLVEREATARRLGTAQERVSRASPIWSASGRSVRTA